MKRRTVLSLEQALSLPYATLRFVHLGWRVIKIEATPAGGILPGDPNRYIGARIAESDRRSYFVAPNVGKESLALNLKDPRAHEVLRRVIRALDVDVFCCNTLPARYKAFGIDYDSLSRVKPDLIWAGISAMGPDYPEVPGYDPATQAMAGYMELTGERDGPPMLSGVPLIDLKAGDEVYAAVGMALAERAETGRGKVIHVSMLQAAASWLITTLPLVDFDCAPAEVSRAGNEHRKFVPTNAYPTADGFVFVTIGNDAQWQRLTRIPKFSGLGSDVRRTNEGRQREREAIHHEIAAITRRHPTAELMRDLAEATIPHAPIHSIPQVMAIEALRDRLTTTVTPDGKTVRMQPPAVDLERAGPLRFPPRYGEQSRAILREAGFDAASIDAYRAARVIAVPDDVPAD